MLFVSLRGRDPKRLAFRDRNVDDVNCRPLLRPFVPSNEGRPKKRLYFNFGLRATTPPFLSPRSSCIDLCFDICGRDYHEAAGAVVEQLAQDTLADDSDANAAPLRPGRHILELAQGERAWE